jgi:MFS family permease
VIKTPGFYFMWIAYALGTSAGLMVISQLVPFARGKGLSAALATTAIFIGASGNASGRILSGWLSDAIGRLNTLRLMIAISVVAMPILYHVGSSVGALYVLVFVVYWCYGTQLSVNASTAADFWEPRMWASTTGCCSRRGVAGSWTDPRRPAVRHIQRLSGRLHRGVICAIALVSRCWPSARRASDDYRQVTA